MLVLIQKSYREFYCRPILLIHKHIIRFWPKSKVCLKWPVAIISCHTRLIWEVHGHSKVRAAGAKDVWRDMGLNHSQPVSYLRDHQVGKHKDGFKSAFFSLPPPLHTNKSLNPFRPWSPHFLHGPGRFWNMLSFSFSRLTRDTGWWDFCLLHLWSLPQNQLREAAGPTREQGCLVISADRYKILLTTSQAEGFEQDLNLKCDTRHRLTWSGPTERTPYSVP